MKRSVPPAPLLIRAALAAERIHSALLHLHEIFRDETLCAWFDPPRRAAINQRIYGAQEAAFYLPGGTYFARGLFDWERCAFTEPPFPRAGRVLLGAAGGGREMLALCKMGFDVVAFEPSELCEGARQVAASFPNSVAVQASYEDLIETAERRTGPLAAHVLGVSFDAVVLGWTSFSNFAASDRADLFRATRAIAPKAPLFASFFPGSAEDGRLDGVRPFLRRIYAWLGAPATRGSGDAFFARAGFIHFVSKSEVEALARAAGYRVLYYRDWGLNCPCAMLLPE